ncbi:MAG: hypothetical protein VW551_00575 [Euryarchaeota archaeon]|jgi:hypothetical protein
MSFNWDRIHKWETNIEDDILRSCEEYICEFYSVDLIDDLSKEQIDEVRKFQEELNEFSVMQYGLRTVLELWEASKVEMGDFEDDADYDY